MPLVVERAPSPAAGPRVRLWLSFGFLALLVNSGYLNAFPDPNLFYVASIVAHLALGLTVLVGLRLAPLAVALAAGPCSSG